MFLAACFIVHAGRGCATKDSPPCARLFHLKLEVDGSERREDEARRAGAAHPGLGFGAYSAEIADVRATVGSRVGAEDFTVEAGLRQADAVVLADDRRAVQDDHKKIIGIFSAAKEGKDAVVRIVAVDPFEAAPVEIHLMERRFGGVQTVEVRDEAVNALVQIELEEVPIEAASFAPFGALRDFAAHEEQFFAGMRVLVGKKEAEIGELLP